MKALSALTRLIVYPFLDYFGVVLIAVRVFISTSPKFMEIQFKVYVLLYIFRDVQWARLESCQTNAAIKVGASTQYTTNRLLAVLYTTLG